MTSSTATRVGPVYFQPLEDELRPVAHYLTGHILNAGCGTRDIRPALLPDSVSELTRYDLESQDPDVIVGPLETLPFHDRSFDSVLCNAVLEHVLDAEASMRELARVVKPGGHVVVAVPFLQPFHPRPTDFRRYTAAGLADLGRRAGLEVRGVLPVHSIAQTIGWIIWEYAQEKGGRLRRGAAWLLAYLLTRFWSTTDTTLVHNANTFQAVFQRPPSDDAIVSGEWRARALAPAVQDVPTMLVPDELRLLQYVAEDWYSGQGAIVDAGSFLGGSTVTLAEGLQRNLQRRGQPESRLIHSYDRFEVEDWTIGPFFEADVRPGESFKSRFERNIAAYADLVEVHSGDVRAFPWMGGPIELLFVDIAKHWRVCDWISWQFFPWLIPGKSLVVQQDYLYHHWVAWLHVTMEYYADYFEYVCDTEVNSVVFRNTRRIPPDVLREHTVESLSLDEKIALMD